MSKLFKDSIHGYIKVSKLALKIIDTPEFQRLRYISQLGTAYFVFPTATHSRFEHSLGTYHLAGEFLEDLKIENKKELIKIAGLCHDLGHGPYSHVFDDEFIKSDSKYSKHENRSCLILEHIVNKYQVPISKEDLKFIQSLILAEKKDYLYQIISNPVNSIDVDKFDYITRDAYTLGLKYRFDYQRLMKEAKIIDNNICYPKKMCLDLQQLFLTRYLLHKQIYNHPISKSIEFMMRDILLILDKKYHISEKIENPEEFCQITDHTIIELAKTIPESNKLYQDILTRNLYPYLGEILLDRKQELKLDLSDKFIVQKVCIGYISGKKANPTDNIYFYDKNSEESQILKPSQISSLIPDRYQEFSIRIYLKDRDYLDQAREIMNKIRMKKKIEKLFN